jgi:uncharacterized delta-60 repeat protein
MKSSSQLFVLSFLLNAMGCGVAAASVSPILDGGFGTHGIAHETFGPDDFLTALALLSDGSVVVGGYSQTISGDRQIYTGGLSKFRPNGSVDSSFGSAGTQQLTISGFDGLSDIEETSNGKLAIAGAYLGPDGETVSMFAGRLNEDGTPDTTFNFGGYRGIAVGTFLSGSTLGDVSRIVSLAEGKLLGVGYVVGSTSECAAVFLLNSDGSFDTTFANANGFACYTSDVLTTPFFAATDVAIDGSGNIVLVGAANQVSSTADLDMAVLRLTPDGSIDHTFGSNGFAFVSFDLGGGLADIAEKILIDSKGRIVLAGEADDSSGDRDIVAARFTSNGQLDSSFGLLGRVDLPNIRGIVRGFASTPEDQFFISVDGSASATVVSLDSDGALSTTFGNSGVYTQGVSLYTITNPSKVIFNADDLYFSGSAYASPTDQEFGVERLIVPIFRDSFDGQ